MTIHASGATIDIEKSTMYAGTIYKQKGNEYMIHGYAKIVERHRETLQYRCKP